ncbi:hypothetical protein H8959_004795 [Pygathrix nigripes]
MHIFQKGRQDGKGGLQSLCKKQTLATSDSQRGTSGLQCGCHPLCFISIQRTAIPMFFFSFNRREKTETRELKCSCPGLQHSTRGSHLDAVKGQEGKHSPLIKGVHILRGAKSCNIVLLVRAADSFIVKKSLQTSWLRSHPPLERGQNCSAASLAVAPRHFKRGAFHCVVLGFLQR